MHVSAFKHEKCIYLNICRLLIPRCILSAILKVGIANFIFQIIPMHISQLIIHIAEAIFIIQAGNSKEKSRRRLVLFLSLCLFSGDVLQFNILSSHRDLRILSLKKSINRFYSIPDVCAVFLLHKHNC